MSTRLGQNVARRSGLVAWIWAAACAGLIVFSPDWKGLIQNDEFAFLDRNSPSQKAERVFRNAFPLTLPVDANGATEGAASEVRRTPRREEERQPRLQDPLRSNLVIVVVRKDRGRHGLQPEDFDFIEHHLRPSLEQIAETSHAPPRRGGSQVPTPSERVILDIWTPTHPQVGPLLESEDNKAAMVVLELRSADLDRGNDQVIARIEELLNSHGFRQQKPAGLDLALSGTAVIARDVDVAEQRTARQVEWISLLVMGTIITLLYRAPFLTIASVGAAWLAVHGAIGLVGLVTEWWQGTVDSGLPITVRIVGYLTAAVFSVLVLSDCRASRIAEENDAESAPNGRGRHWRRLALLGAGVSISLMGLIASEFGRLRLAGMVLPVVVAMSSATVLLVLPVLFRSAGRLAFWPDIRREQLSTSVDWMPSLRLSGRLGESDWLGQWAQQLTGWLRTRRLLTAAVGFVLVIPAFIAIARHDQLNYGKLAQLPVDFPSVAGALAVTEQDPGSSPRFPAGITGATTLLLRNDTPEHDLRANSRQGRQLSQQIADQLWENAATLGLADIRCEAYPWGMSERAMEIPATLVGRSMVGLRTLLPAKGGIARTRVINKRAHDAYTSTDGELSGKVMRIDLVFDHDPLSAITIDSLTAVEQAVQQILPESHAETKLYSLGPTASLRDLKSAADQDRWRLPLLTAVIVWLMLWGATRRLQFSLIVVIGTSFGALAALGITRSFYSWPTAGEPAALDWYVPVMSLSLVIAFAPMLLVDLLQRDTDSLASPTANSDALAVLVAVTLLFIGVALSLLFSPLAGATAMGVAIAGGGFLGTTLVRLARMITSSEFWNSSPSGPAARRHSITDPDSNSLTPQFGAAAPYRE